MSHSPLRSGAKDVSRRRMARFTFLPVAFGGRGAGRRPAGRRVPRLILPRADRGRIFFCPALAAGAFFPPAIGAKRLLPAAFWGFQDSENLVKSASLRRSSPQPPL